MQDQLFIDSFIDSFVDSFVDSFRFHSRVAMTAASVGALNWSGSLLVNEMSVGLSDEPLVRLRNIVSMLLTCEKGRA